MLIPQVSRAVRQNSTIQNAIGRQMRAQLRGEEVVVLVAGRYNGPDHKSLGFCHEGSVIRIATGDYLAYNLANGLVRLMSELTVAPEDQAVATPVVVEQPATSHTDLMEAGVSEKQAKALYEAGFVSREAVMRSFGVFGLNEILAVKGISEAKARELLKWAGVVIPED